MVRAQEEASAADALEVEAGGRPGLSGMTPDEIVAAVQVEPYQARQLFHWIHQKRVFDFDRMTDLSKDLREKLAGNFSACELSLSKTSGSARGGTKKVLLALPDGETIEAVYLPARDRVTLCLSTQVGCAVKCSFCATGLSGYARNLTAGEIVEQALFLLEGEDLEGRTPNIVFMGMGEPFRNYDATMESIRLLMNREGLGIGARRITVSTAGEVEAIRRFASEDWQVRLSVSLHAANDALRSELVPLNRRYNLGRLMDAVTFYGDRTGRQVTFEWTLIEGVNDSARDADEFAALIGGFKAFVNLIPYNPVAGLEYRPPSRAACESFRARLAGLGVHATLRQERGQDIDAACGQLRRRASAADASA